jgi:hypothetical protein
MIGIKDIKLISRANHIISQFLLDSAIIVLITIMNDVSKVNGEFFMRDVIGVEPSKLS